MTRLPTPGQDNGIWGAILNDFLSQSLSSDGKLKSGVVSDDQVSSLSQSKITGLAASFASKADDSLVVHQDVVELNVKDYGAKGDGNTDDTAAFASAITAAAGAPIYAPSGTYIINSITVSSVLRLRLHGATIKHKTNASNSLLNFTGTALEITGDGTIDGNVSGQTTYRPLIVLAVPSTAQVKFCDIRCTAPRGPVFYVTNFGGEFDVSRCHFDALPEHDGTAGHITCVMNVVSGQVGAKGRLRFSSNTAIGTDAPAIAGGAPGGIFFAPVTNLASGVGNFSTLEAIGNHFWGIGQDCAGEDISPIHCYPVIDGARVIGNYFEKCGFCAISAKSVNNFVCANNVIVNGVTSSMNIASEGAISYAPGYQSASNQRHRAVITGNIVDTPGGQPAAKQVGIAVLGTASSHATGVIIAENILSNCGIGITANQIDDASITGNVIEGATGGTDESGMRIDNAFGAITISGNRIASPNGDGLIAFQGLSTASFHVTNNYFEHSSSTHYGVTVRGCAYLKFSGNTVNASAGISAYFTADGTTKIARFDAGENTYVGAGGAPVFDFANITSASGRLQYTSLPQGVVTPAEIGTLYRKTNGVQGSELWVSLGTTNTSWAPILDAGTAGATPSGVVAAGAGTGATISIDGTDVAGLITVTAGTTPTVGSAVAAITFATTRAAKPRAVILQPANSNAALLAANCFVAYTTPSTTGFVISNTTVGLTGGLGYYWYYWVV